MKENEYIKLRQSVLSSILLMIALFGMPLAVITPIQERSELHTETENGEVQDILEIEEETASEEEPIIRVMQEGRIEEMELSDYLTGVVRAEMPASFELEALKAQAVAARTYTFYKLTAGSSHGEAADICTESTCCQAYTDRESAWENWGNDAEAFEKKIRCAVEGTNGQVLLYEGSPILAVFHAASAGMTRAAGSVWSSDLPYLQPVSSPEPEAGIPNYYSKKAFSTEEFRSMILAMYQGARFSEEADSWLSGAVTDEAGHVEQVTVGGVTIKGTELRRILGLRSACFSWEIKENTITFYVTGYGHGVGLSQHGANQMAKDGANWKEILSHYYTGVTVEGYCFTNTRQT